MLRGNVPVREMAANQPTPLLRLAMRLFGKLFVPPDRYTPLFLLEGARRIREEVGIPVIYVGGVLSLEHLEEVLRAGCAFAQVGRATVRDSHFAARLAGGEIRESDCDLCNRCIAAMEAGGVRCVSAERGLEPRPF
jgi:2,4-dienoyl-CoA reductase-like NADH-dependent reductase (Old Yellow Enzyme family)